MSERLPPDPTVDHVPPSDLLDAGLAAAFGPEPASAPAAASVLEALAASLPGVPRVQLRDPDSGAHAPVVRPASAEMPPEASRPPAAVGRLQLQGEISRGGMGAILKGHDSDLGRDLAVKILLDKHRDRPELVQRFVEEAQIAGQLQHPGVTPVYELGQLPDRRPYFTMKLVKGRTLAALLAGRPDPAQERPRFLKVFGQVCQTLAYAHARGVIHRDLKPSNIMVGAFGEVQVMDWGLAKVLPQGGAADEAASRQREEEEDATVIRTQRSGAAGTAGSGPDTQTGSVLGTPAYISPEQARGEVAWVDERADVFGLGALLCELLTGRAPFPGPREQALRAAQRGDLADAFARLDGCGADAELVALAQRCLAAEPAGRPRDAGAVDAIMTAYLESVERRLRAAELAGAEAKARAAEERKRRRLTLALAAAGLLIVLAGGGGGLWVIQDRAARQADAEQQASRALGKVEQLMEDAGKAVPETPAAAERVLVLWRQALAAAEQAESIRATGPVGDDTARRVSRLLAEARTGADQARKDAQALSDLNIARMARSKADGLSFDVRACSELYARAFADYGLDMLKSEAPTSARALGALRPHMRHAFLVALDDWILAESYRDDLKKRQDILKRLQEVAAAGNDDPWWRRFRQARDVQALRALAAEARDKVLPAGNLEMLGRALWRERDRAEATALLRLAQHRYPGDFWINFDLGNFIMEYDRRSKTKGDAVGFFRAALAVQPDSAPARNNLGNALREAGDLEGSMAEFQKSIALAPSFALPHYNLGNTLSAKGDKERALAEYNKAIALDPTFAKAHHNRGNMLRDRGDYQGAVAAYRKAIKHDPKDALYYYSLSHAYHHLKDRAREEAALRQSVKLDNYAMAHMALGTILAARGDWEGAVAKYRRAIALDPRTPRAHDNLGDALSALGDRKRAEAAYREAMKLDPKDAQPHNGLGILLATKGDLQGAAQEFRKALALDPRNAKAHHNLGEALGKAGEIREALEHFEEALRLDPNLAEVHQDRGLVLFAKGDLDEAIASFRKAIGIKPKWAKAHGILGLALLQRGRFAEAKEASQRALRLLPAGDRLRMTVSGVLSECDRLLVFEQKLPAFLKGEAQPANARERFAVGQLCQYKRQYASAARFYRDALAADPKLAEQGAGVRFEAALAAALAGCGRGEDAKDLDEKGRANWRRQALAWLRAELAGWVERAKGGNRQVREWVPLVLRPWQEHVALAGVRDEAALDRLPAAERAAWRQLWAEVGTVLQKSQK